jgi:hypothetical protein
MTEVDGIKGRRAITPMVNSRKGQLVVILAGSDLQELLQYVGHVNFSGGYARERSYIINEVKGNYLRDKVEGKIKYMIGNKVIFYN